MAVSHDEFQADEDLTVENVLNISTMPGAMPPRLRMGGYTRVPIGTHILPSPFMRNQ